MSQLKSWLSPLIIALSLFLIAQPVLAQVLQSPSDISTYLASNTLAINSEIVNGYTQIYYEFNQNRVFITSGNTNFRQPHSAGEYVTFVGDVNEAGQIFLYHIPTQKTLQLTNIGTNLKPQTDSLGRVVWEGWVDNSWQIFYFDGTKATQFTSGPPAINPKLNGDYLIYATETTSGQWKSVAHSFSADKTIDILVGPQAKNLNLDKNQVILPSGDSVHLNSFFALDSSLESIPTPTPETPHSVSPDEILNEISPPAATSAASTILPEASESATLLEASNSATLPEASESGSISP